MSDGGGVNGARHSVDFYDLILDKARQRGVDCHRRAEGQVGHVGPLSLSEVHAGPSSGLHISQRHVQPASSATGQSTTKNTRKSGPRQLKGLAEATAPEQPTTASAIAASRRDLAGRGTPRTRSVVAKCRSRLFAEEALIAIQSSPIPIIDFLSFVAAAV